MARTCLASYMGPGDLNSGPHAYTAGTLTHWTASSALQLFTLIPGPVDNIGVLQPFPLNWDTLCRKEEGHSRDSGSKHASHVWGRGNLRDSQAPLLKVVKQQTPQDYGKSKKKKKNPQKNCWVWRLRGAAAWRRPPNCPAAWKLFTWFRRRRFCESSSMPGRAFQWRNSLWVIPVSNPSSTLL